MSATDTGEFARPTAQDRTAARSRSSATTTTDGRGFAVTGIVLGVIAVFFLPFVVGPVAILFGYLGHNRGDSLGRTAMIVAGVGTVIGLGLMVWTWQLLFG